MSFTSARVGRRRVLQISYACHPDSSMESRLSWHRAVESSKEFDTWVMCHAPLSLAAPDAAKVAPGAPWSPRPGLWLVPLEPSLIERGLLKTPGFFYSAYHHYHRRALRQMQTLHRELKFDLIHQVGFCGFREPGYGWKLEAPFLWGPIGGTQNLPLQFVRQLNCAGGTFEVLRNAWNTVHFRFRRRVRHAMTKATHIWTATSLSQSHFRSVHGIETEVQLETGISELPPPVERARKTNEPLRILWAGRLEPWKALPLLLRALATMPTDVPFELHVLGKGSCQSSWKRLADRLGLAHRIQWIGWPDYRTSWNHYAWADLFVFTSLRDTSGTGLLEALAHGCPVVALHHQGAADIVTESSGVRIPANSPAQVISDLRAQLVRLARSPGDRRRLGEGARQRAEQYLWCHLGERMRATYWRVLLGDHAQPLPSSTVEAKVESIGC